MKIEYHFIITLLVLFSIVVYLYTFSCKGVIVTNESGNSKIDNMPIWGCPDKDDKFSRISKAFDGIKENQSMGLYDKWSFTHITHGYILFTFFNYLNNFKKDVYLFYTCVFMELFWEVFENRPNTVKHYRKLRNMYRDYVGDSLLNIVSDIIFIIFGIILAWHLPIYVNLFLILIFEIIAYYKINDSVLVTLISAIFKIFAKLSYYAKVCNEKGLYYCYGKVSNKVYEKFIKFKNKFLYI